MRFLINKCIGGFGLSAEIMIWIVENKPEYVDSYDYSDDDLVGDIYFEEIRNGYKVETIKYEDGTTSQWSDGIYKDGKLYYLSAEYKIEFRCDEDVIKKVLEIGLEESAFRHSKLKIVDVPDDVEVDLGVSDQGPEWIFEKHRIWS